MRYAKLWAGLAVVILGSFAILGYHAIELHRTTPPVPVKVVAGDANGVVFTGSASAGMEATPAASPIPNMTPRPASCDACASAMRGNRLS